MVGMHYRITLDGFFLLFSFLLLITALDTRSIISIPARAEPFYSRV